jgi:predicted RNA methylase
MKPVELVERAIRNSSKTRDTILDPFAGSGTTAIACEKAGRQARLIELDPKYCDVVIRRWQQWSGKQARHEQSGRAFNDVAVGAIGGKAIDDGLAGTIPFCPGQPELITPPGEPGGAGAAA